MLIIMTSGCIQINLRNTYLYVKIFLEYYMYDKSKAKNLNERSDELPRQNYWAPVRGRHETEEAVVLVSNLEVSTCLILEQLPFTKNN